MTFLQNPHDFWNNNNVKQVGIFLLCFLVISLLGFFKKYQFIPIVLLPVIIGYLGYLQFNVVTERDLRERKRHETVLKRTMWGILGFLLVAFVGFLLYFGYYSK